MAAQSFDDVIAKFRLSEVDLDDAVVLASQYLVQYGYLEARMRESILAAELGTSRLVEAMNDFMDFHGLGRRPPETPLAVLLSPAVLSKMNAPRCRFSDHDGLSNCRWSTRSLAVSINSFPKFRARDLTDNQIREEIHAAFGNWERQSRGALRFTFDGSAPADIEVVWFNSENPFRSHVGDVVGDADLPPNCSNSGLPKRIRLDGKEHRWVVGPAIRSFDIQSVVVHEIGHILGFGHPPVGTGSVMEPDYQFNQMLDPHDIGLLGQRYP